MIEIKNYAPVIIPTLNRYEHFKNCVESLSNNIGADKTIVYIGLDYPANDSHKEGYFKIKKYLSNHNLKFKEVCVYEREYNYGVGANGNGAKLMIEVAEKHDRYIFSEDDNIFSPYFLQYINWGLSKYEKDSSVIAICGYTLPVKGNIINTDDTLFENYSFFSAWGYGIWTNKMNELFVVNSKWAKSILKDSELIKRVIEGGPSDVLPALIGLFHHNDRKSVWITDRIITLYNVVYNKCTISPIKTKVKNCGWDGSGKSISSKDNTVLENAYHYNAQKIDYSPDSVYVIANKEFSQYYSQQISDSFIYDQVKRAEAKKKLVRIMKIGIENYYSYLQIKYFIKNTLMKCFHNN